MHRKSLAEGGLSRTRWPGDKHHAHRILFIVVAVVDILGYLHYLLFLQCFAHLYQFACLSFLACLVHRTHILQAHNHIPSHIFGKYSECARHIYLFSQEAWILLIGDTQQKSVVIWLNAKHLQIARRWHKRTIIIVDSIAKCIIIGINPATGFKQLHLIGKSRLAKQLYCIFGERLSAMKWHIFVHYLLHTLSYHFHIVLGDDTSIGFMKITEITVRYRVLHIEPASRKHIKACLIEHKAQRTHIRSHSARGANIEKLHIAVLIDSEFKSLRRIVHSRRHRLIF